MGRTLAVATSSLLRRQVLLLAFAVPTLAGCGQVLASNENASLRIGFIAPTSDKIAYQERKAIMLAFSEANARRAIGERQLILEDGSSDLDLAVLAGARSNDETLLGDQVASVSISREKSGLSLQPMRSLDCASAAEYRSCDATLSGRQRVFALRFRAFAGEPARREAYIAYAEAESLIAASQRLAAEGQLSFKTLRRALLFGEFSTLIGQLRYAVPPEMIDETLHQNALAMSS
jgi:hypothetical protein